MPRLFPIAFLLAVACLSPARAQEKPKSEPKTQQPRTKAAEHATDGDEHGAATRTRPTRKRKSSGRE